MRCDLSTMRTGWQAAAMTSHHAVQWLQQPRPSLAVLLMMRDVAERLHQLHTAGWAHRGVPPRPSTRRDHGTRRSAPRPCSHAALVLQARAKACARPCALTSWFGAKS